MRNFIFLFFISLVLLTACAPQEPAAEAAAPDTFGEAAFCTADVQECPDGSFVSRVAPDCAFKPCP